MEPTPTTGSGPIDWGIEVAAAGDDCGSGRIDWDLGATGEEGGAATGAAEATGGGIDWGIEVSAGGDTDGGGDTSDSLGGGIDWGAISFEGLELQGEGIQEAAEDESLLSDPHARELLYQDVAEVGAFLRARCSELSGSFSTEYCRNGEDKSLDEVKAFAAVMSKAEELLAGRRTQRLQLLQSSERYLGQHISRVEIAKAQCGKPATQRAALDKLKAEQVEEAKRARAEIDKLRTATHKVQKQLEEELSTHFKSSVRIVGEIAQI
mmetsp:Transcript_113787/g.353492  ORF Transcript_113787/g.353492 Transcript_113787/m.353492 type:complete len:265 (-) Transcript_113787:32-826(-)